MHNIKRADLQVGSFYVMYIIIINIAQLFIFRKKIGNFAQLNSFCIK